MLRHLALGFFLLLVGFAAGGSPQIVDPEGDAYLRTFSPVVGLPHPAVDLRFVTFSGSGPVHITIGVQDLAADNIPLQNYYRVFTVNFVPGTHDLMTVSADEIEGQWRATMLCWDRGAPSCSRVLDEPIRDYSAGTLTLTVPTDDIQHFHSPNANSGLFPKPLPRAADLRPNFGFQDFAPDQGAGADFNP